MSSSKMQKGNNKATQDTSTVVCLICLEVFDDRDLLQQHPAKEEQDDDNDDNDVERGIIVPRTTGVLALPHCQHVFCHDCLVAHVQHAIESKRVLPMTCPEFQCRTELPSTLVTRLVRSLSPSPSSSFEEIPAQIEMTSPQQRHETSMAQKLKRLQALAQNPDLVDCPLCHALVQVKSDGNNETVNDDDDDDVNDKNDLTCPVCQGSFCRIHGISHAQMTCPEFMASPRGQALQATEQVLDACTKPCSHCGARLYKQVGCDYVSCPHCRRAMCYACGSHRHLSAQYRYCTQCGGPAHYDLSCWMECWTTVSICIMILLYPPIGLLLVLVTGCCCACAFCGRALPAEDANLNNNNNNSNDDTLATRRCPRSWAPRRGWIATLMVIAGPFAILLGDTGADHWRLHLLPHWVTPRFTRAQDIPRHDDGEPNNNTNTNKSTPDENAIKTNNDNSDNQEANLERNSATLVDEEEGSAVVPKGK